jgi:hypothetical protein
MEDLLIIYQHNKIYYNYINHFILKEMLIYYNKNYKNNKLNHKNYFKKNKIEKINPLKLFKVFLPPKKLLKIIKIFHLGIYLYN